MHILWPRALVLEVLEGFLNVKQTMFILLVLEYYFSRHYLDYNFLKEKIVDPTGIFLKIVCTMVINSPCRIVEHVSM